MKKVQFNIEKFFKELLKEKDIEDAIRDSGQEIFLESNDEYEAFENTMGCGDDIEANFQRLDKSFKCSTILEINDQVGDIYLYSKRIFYLSTIKSKHSFVIHIEQFNSNFDNQYVMSKHKNIKKKDIKNLSKDLFDQWDQSERYCEQIILNNAYIWGTDSEYKKFKSENIIPNSLKKLFLPIFENKKKYMESLDDYWEGDDEPLYKYWSSIICILNEKDMNKMGSGQYEELTNIKGAIWSRIDE